MARPEVDTAFNGNAEQFADYGEHVRGYIRYEVAHRNLEAIVSGDPLLVADVGGGSGRDTLWLAERGHTVTLIEPADDQLVLARARFAEATEDVQSRITIIQATPDEVIQEATGKFDLVLSHGVAMYDRNPQKFVTKLAALAKVGGHISLLEKGYYGKQAHLVATQQWEALAQLTTDQMAMNNAGKKAWCFKPYQLADMLKRASIKYVNWSGVRVVGDNLDMPVTDLTPNQLQAIVDADYQQGHDEHLRYQGQMLHFIGRKVLG